MTTSSSAPARRAACVANRLSADPACRVLLLEAGGSDRNIWLKLPVGYYRTIYNDALLAAVQDRAGRRHRRPLHRLAARPRARRIVVDQRPDLHSRPARGFRRLGAARRRPAGATATCCRTSAATNAIAAARASITAALGEFEVSDLRNDNAACSAWVDAGVEFGLPRNPDFNGETTYGVGSYQLGIGKRWRSSSASAFLHPIAHRANLTVITGAQVSRVLFRRHGRDRRRMDQGRAARSARAPIAKSSCRPARCSRRRFCSSPASARPALLRGLGIDVVADSPEVGRNLQDHYQARTDRAAEAAAFAERSGAQSRRAGEDGAAMDVRRQRSADRRRRPGRRRRLHRTTRSADAPTFSST